MLINEVLNAQEQLNLLKIIYDNTWAALNQQAKRQSVKHKATVSHNVPRPATVGKRKAKPHTQAKPAAVPVQPLPKPQTPPQPAQTKPKPFNTPKSQPYSSRPAQTQNRAFGSNSQNAISSADSTQVGRVGIASRNTNT